MLQGRLTPALIVGVTLLTSCTGSGGAIRDNVIEPGITAIDQAGELQCSQDASTLRVALDAYEMLNGTPAADEQTLIDSEYLREASDVWDVVHGQLIAADPGCGDVPADIPEAEIVTSTEPLLMPEEVFAGFTAEQIESVGGTDCARELAALFSAGERYSAQTGDTDPDGFQAFIDAGVLDQLPVLWTTDGTDLLPVDGSGCRVD